MHNQDARALSNTDVLVDYLEEHPGAYCDDCLSDMLEIKPRQQINQICNRLAGQNRIVRAKARCASCGRDKLVNTFSTSLQRVAQSPRSLNLAKLETRSDSGETDPVDNGGKGHIVDGPVGNSKETVSNRIETIIYIKEGETGHSYESLFGPYLAGARVIHLVDPYIRLEYQIRNFLSFTNVLSASEEKIDLVLTTRAESSPQEQEISAKLSEISDNLAQHGIRFRYEFDPTIHDRNIELDNGWRINLSRGLDIFQKPDSRYGLGELDQAKRKCRQSSVVYLRTT